MLNWSSMNKVFGASLLVAGTTIGAGMLALPVVTGFAGMIPSALLFIFYWLFMLFTAFLILEVNLWMGERANMISMAKKTLGPVGELIAWGAYLLLLYALMTAYLASSGPLVIGFFKSVTGIILPEWVSFVPLLGIFAYFVIMGTAALDKLNRILMIGLGASFLYLIFVLVPHVEYQKLQHVDFWALDLAVSVAATSFGFHIIIPNMTTYLERDVPKLKKSLLIGSFIPLVIYLMWEVVTLGIIPLSGPHSIESGYQQGITGAEVLANLLNMPGFSMVARAFAFFAVVTSFLGVSLSLSSCLADGLHLRQIKAPPGLVDVLTFLPPLIIALIDPRAFLTALTFAGIFGVIVLLAFLPACMVYKGRYSKKFEGPYTAPGGKPALYAVILISTALIILEIYR